MEGKRLLGSQIRKRRLLTLQLDEEDKAKNNLATDSALEIGD
jgi:hypothetical protein